MVKEQFHPQEGKEWTAPKRETREQEPEQKDIEAAEPEPEDQEELPSFGTVAEIKRAVAGVVEKVGSLMPFEYKKPVDTTPEDDEEQPDFSTPLSRLGKNRFARGFFALAGLLGAGKSIEAGANALERIDTQNEAVQELRMQLSDLDYEPISDLPEPEDEFTLDDGTTTTYGELKTVVDQVFTYGMDVPTESGEIQHVPGLLDTKDAFGNKWGGASWLMENFGETLPDGTKVVDTLHTTIAAPELRNANFGLSSDFFDAVGQTRGISGEDVKLYDDMMRDSLWYRADMAGGMPYMHGDLQELPLGFDRAEIRQDMQEFADDLALDVISAADLDNADPETRREVVSAVQEIIRTEVELQKARIELTQEIDNYGSISTEQDIEKKQQEVQDLETKLDLATKTLGLKADGLKPVAEQLSLEHQENSQQFYETAKKSGVALEVWEQAG